MTVKKFLKKAGKWVAYMLVFLLALIVVACIFINTNYAKRIIRDKAQSYLQNKLHTKVVIGGVDFSFPEWIEVNNVYIEDQDQDTLLSGGKIAVEIDMLKLFRSNIYIRKIRLENIYANISRPAKDSVFNYQFIIDSFASKKTSAKPVDTSTTDLTIKGLLLHNIRLKYADDYGGTNITAAISNLDISLNKFKRSSMQFGINKFKTDSVDLTMIISKNGEVGTPGSKNNLQLLLDQADLGHVNIAFTNKVNGMYYGNTVQHLTIKNAKVDLGTEDATVDKVALDSSFVQFISPTVASAKKLDTASVKAATWHIGVKDLQLHNDQVQFDNNIRKPTNDGIDLNHLNIQHINIVGNDITYSSDTILATIDQLSFIDKSGFVVDTTHAKVIYSNKEISTIGLYLKTPQSLLQTTATIQFDDIKTLMATPVNTSINVTFTNSVIAVNDLYLLSPSVKRSLPPQKFRNNFIKLNTVVDGTLQQLNVHSLQVAGLSGSVINAKAVLYNITDSNKLAYDATIYNSTIQKADIIKFIPSSDKTDRENIEKIPVVLLLNTYIRGDLKNTIADVNVNSAPFKLIGKANIKNLNNTKRLQYDVVISNSRIEKSFISTVIPQGTIPPNISLPDIIIITGSAKGDRNNIQPDLKLDGNYGIATVKGYVYNFQNKEEAVYDLQFTTNNFAIGRLIKKDTLIGTVSLAGSAKGRGFNYKTMHMVVTASVSQAGFEKYNYKNISLTANLNGGNITSAGSVSDSNIRLQYTVLANTNGKYPSATATILVDTVQLQKLHLYNDVLNGSFKVKVKAPSLDPNNMDVYVAIDSSKINLKNKIYYLDSIIAKANKADGITEVSLRSPVADITAKGDFDYSKIGESVEQYVNKYYKISDKSFINLPPQQIVFSGKIKKYPMVTDLLPGLAYDSVNFKGSFDSKDGDSALNFSADVPYFVYKTNEIGKGKISIASANGRINATASFDTLDISNNIFYGASANIYAAKDSLSVDVATKDGHKNQQYVLGAIITEKDKTYTVSVKDNLLLNYQKWDVAGDNKIIYSPQGFLVNDFLLSDRMQKVSITSKQNVLNSPIDVSIDSFNIKDITSILNKDTLLASGFIKGNFTMGDFDKKLPSFTGNIEFVDLQIMQQPVGDIKITAQKINDNTINATASLTENGNDVIIKGNYYPNNAQKQFDADIDIKQLRMLTIQAFTQGNIARSSGGITGKVALKGTFEEPYWNGYLAFDTAKFTITKLGTAYTIDQQKILLNSRDISFKNFTIKDSVNNAMVIGGDITARSLSNYDLDMNIHARKFVVINTPKTIDNQLYGFAAINTDITVQGNSNNPDVEGNISLNEKSDVTMVLPQNNINKDEAKSVVRFIDRDTFALPEKKPFVIIDQKTSTFAQFVNYNLNVDIPKKAALTVVIDPTTGDELRVQGDAHLNAGVDPGGNLVLAGNYELNAGHYILHYQFLTRQFDLLPGSTIAFGGEPSDAQINISAQYIVNTSAVDLLDNEISEVDPKTAATFNQKVPFKVLLYLKGTIKKPEISFDIQMPDDNTEMSSELRSVVDNKLVQLRQDVAGINKEVFSLL
ncbi:MAG TPA: translocation/assembly module TamB domain-containing protein, partial [Ferruginibacter sp.]|nr:translocation/assembly module TamB domain-containing protein [Ferruginibacter sp.]